MRFGDLAWNHDPRLEGHSTIRTPFPVNRNEQEVANASISNLECRVLLNATFITPTLHQPPVSAPYLPVDRLRAYFPLPGNPDPATATKREDLFRQTRKETSMPSDSGPSREHTFGSPIDLPSTLEALNIQYLDVNETRSLVIYQTAILNLEVLEGDLSAASRIELEVYEDPREEFSTETEREEGSVSDLLLDQLIDSR